MELRMAILKSFKHEWMCVLLYDGQTIDKARKETLDWASDFARNAWEKIKQHKAAELYDYRKGDFVDATGDTVILVGLEDSMLQDVENFIVDLLEIVDDYDKDLNIIVSTWSCQIYMNKYMSVENRKQEVHELFLAEI